MPAGVITTGSIPRLLQDGVNKIFGQVYDEHSVEYDKLFKTQQSGKAFEVDVQVESFGLAVEKSQGQDITFDSFSQGISPKYVNSTFGKGFIMTEEALEDNQYAGTFKQAGSLAFSMRQTKEVNGANIFNNGFTSGTMVDGDGVVLFSASHVSGPTGGTYSNILAVAADLSEASLEDMLVQIADAEDSRGLKIALKPEMLHVSSSAPFEAQRILHSVLRVGTSDNDDNAIRSMNAIPGGYAVNHYFTDPDAWFITTNAPEGLKHFERRAVRFGQDNSFVSGNARFKADERYVFGWTDARGAYGSAGN